MYRFPIVAGEEELLIYAYTGFFGRVPSLDALIKWAELKGHPSIVILAEYYMAIHQAQWKLVDSVREQEQDLNKWLAYKLFIKTARRLRKSGEPFEVLR